MKKSNIFQLVLVIVFIIAGVLGLLVFSGAIKLPSTSKAQKGSGGTVVLWGTANTADMSQSLKAFNSANPTFTVKYVQKYQNTFSQDLLEALASGVGPDMFFLPDTLAYSYKARIFPIPYSSFPLTSYKTKFVAAGDVFLTSKGILAFPITIDPMVMYYNKRILDTNSIIYPPTYWDEFANLIPLLTVKDVSKKISKSTLALGQFSNITNAKDILATLFMQAGSTIVTEKDGRFTTTLGDFENREKLVAALNFYTDFADPLKDVYSWNMSLQNSRDAFSAENVAFYFGYASELQSLIDKNPNQNFGVAPMPQLRGSTSKTTFGHVTGISVSAFSKNFDTAFVAASLMSVSDFASKYASVTGTVPVRRDLLVKKPTDEFSPTFYDSALYAKSWLDPLPQSTDDIFRTMIDKVLTNSTTTQEAVGDASTKLNFLLYR